MLVVSVILVALVVGGVVLWQVNRPARLPPSERDPPPIPRPPPPRPPRPPAPGAPMGP